MPLVDLTCAASVRDETKRALVAALPHAVSLAVACADEPYDADLQPGDVVVRVHDASPFDRLGLDLVVEVWSKWCEDRAADRQQRSDAVLAAVRDVAPGHTAGVSLHLPVTAWAQTD